MVSSCTPCSAHTEQSSCNEIHKQDNCGKDTVSVFHDQSTTGRMHILHTKNMRGRPVWRTCSMVFSSCRRRSSVAVPWRRSSESRCRRSRRRLYSSTSACFSSNWSSFALHPTRSHACQAYVSSPTCAYCSCHSDADALTVWTTRQMRPCSESNIPTRRQPHSPH